MSRPSAHALISLDGGRGIVKNRQGEAVRRSDDMGRLVSPS